MTDMTPNAIATLRARRGWSARQLGEAMGMGADGGRLVRRWEAGETRPTGANLRMLEIIEQGELPEWCLPTELKRGRPVKVVA